MDNQIRQFHSSEFGTIEVLMINEKPFFPASECAAILGYKNPRKAVLDHCKEDGVTNRDAIDNLGRQQEKKYISEGNLYRLIARSRLPAAVRFESLVFDEILPSVRKHGAYVTDEVLEAAERIKGFADELFQRLREERGENAALRGKVEALAPKAGYCDQVLLSGGAVHASVIAKDYGMSAVRFNRLLHDMGIQFRVGKTWVLYKEYAGKGYTKSHTHTACGRSFVHTRWTQAGREFLYAVLGSRGILPADPTPLLQQ